MTAYELIQPGGFVISDDQARLDRAVIHGFLAHAYWSVNRPSALTDRAIAHSICLGLYTPDGCQAGFARVISDQSIRAHLADVFILSEFRGRGFGRAIVVAALEHPALRTVTTWSLTTSDAHGLYAQLGFHPVEHPEKMMMRYGT